MKPFRLGLFSAAVLLIGAAVAMAQETVIISADVNAYSGPSVDSGFAGTIRANTPVVLQHCSDNFCMVQYGRSSVWVQQQYIAQVPAGEAVPPPPQAPQQPQPPANPGWPWPQPQPQPQPLPQPPPVFDEAGACFYSERNFRGSSFCVEEGDSYSRLRNWDNAIRSVEVFGGVRVDLCTDSNYRGSCVTLRRDASRLPTEIDRKTSSIDVY
jgi:hypothetical protein